LAFIYGGDTFDVKKPHPKPLLMAAEDFAVSPSHCVMIGDSINDRQAAREAGFSFIFAAYGYSKADDPALNDGLGTIDTFAELRDLLCRR
jgi:phosphoglycolate phosphatase